MTAAWWLVAAALPAALAAAALVAAYLRRSGRERRESEERYRQLFVGCKVPELIIDPADGTIVDANPAAADYYGYPAGRLRGMRIDAINTLPPEAIAAEMANARAERRHHFFFRHRLASGAVRDVEVHSGPLPVGGRMLLYSIVHDISERRQAEENYRRLFENAGAGLFRTTLEGRFVAANRTLARTMGYPSERAMMREVKDLGQEFYFDPTERDALVARVQAEGAVSDFEARVRRRDGEAIWVSLNMRLVPGEVPLFEGSVIDITHRREGEARLRAAKEAAEAASRAKSEFLAVVSHEVRTPMNTVLGMAELLAETRLDDEQRRYLTAQRRAGETMVALLDDILDLSRIEAGALSIEQEAVAPREVVASVLEIMAGAAAQRGLTLAGEVAEEVPERLVGDPRRLRQILLNLVGNAIKFTPAGWVRVAVSRPAPGELRFAVSDSGVGIAPERQEEIFLPFNMGDSSPTRRHGGLGIGLAIANRLAQGLGGRIEVESAEGEGSTFRVVLPCRETGG